MVDQSNESKDGTGAADHDQKFVFGHPLDGLNLWARMHLTVMRRAIKDYRQGARGGAADGDSAAEP